MVQFALSEKGTADARCLRYSEQSRSAKRRQRKSAVPPPLARIARVKLNYHRETGTSGRRSRVRSRNGSIREQYAGEIPQRLLVQ
jgi:hypothetical protein